MKRSTLRLVQIYFATTTFDQIELDKKIKLEAQLSLIGRGQHSWLPYSTDFIFVFVSLPAVFHDKYERTQQGNLLGLLRSTLGLRKSTMGISRSTLGLPDSVRGETLFHCNLSNFPVQRALKFDWYSNSNYFFYDYWLHSIGSFAKANFFWMRQDYWTNKKRVKTLASMTRIKADPLNLILVF